LRHRLQLPPHKSGSSFGRWAPYLQIPPRQGPLHSLKGMVPEAAAHVPVVVCGRCVGGSAAQRRSSTAASAGMRRWQLACDYTMLATELASDFDSLCSSWQLACDFSSRYAFLCLCCCYVPMFVCLQLACDLSMCARSVFEFDLIDRIRSWTWCRSPFAALVTCRRGSARRAENICTARIIILENGSSVKNAHAQHVATRSKPPRLRQASLHLRLKDSTGLSARTHPRLLISTERVVRLPRTPSARPRLSLRQSRTQPRRHPPPHPRRRPLGS
jgi:hypothetical protein